MAKLCDGRVCIVTGAGRGIGREHALMLAAHGAKVVVNDLGGARDGTGGLARPGRRRWCRRSPAAGGEAVANGDDVSDLAGAERMIQTRGRDASAGSTCWSTTPASCATACWST